jgi:hypothetical protein
MFNERFDKILKKNIEAVRPEYRPQAWERFSKKLPATGLLAFLGQYGGWVLSALMLAGWGTTIYTLQQNQELIRQFKSVGKESARLEDFPGGKLNFESRQATDADTVYVVKKTIVEHRHYSYPEKVKDTPAIPVLDASIVPVTGLRPLVAFTTNPPGSMTDRNSDVSEQGRNYTPGGIEKGIIGYQQALDSLHVRVTGYQVTKADSAGRVLDKEAVMALIDSAWAQQSVIQKTIFAESKNQIGDNPNDVDHFVRERAGRTPFTLSSLEPRFGIASTVSLYGYGLGPSFEIFPTENLGFSFGIHASTVRAENHKVLRDYNSATGKLFLVQYRNYLPARFDRIEDISIKTSVVSLPVQLKYYIPLKPNLSLFMHIGTSLDVSAYQQVSFQSYLNQSKRRNTFEMDVEPHFFNDFMIGPGIQYRRSRIHAQLAPYYVYDFRSIENTAHGGNLGLRGSLWLNLYK